MTDIQNADGYNDNVVQPYTLEWADFIGIALQVSSGILQNIGVGAGMASQEFYRYACWRRKQRLLVQEAARLAAYERTFNS